MRPVGFFDGCQTCGGKRFHKLGCPILTRDTGAVALLLGAVTIGLVIWERMGGPPGNVALGSALTLFFAGYWYLSSRRARAQRP
jgi:hypothetical protein